MTDQEHKSGGSSPESVIPATDVVEVPVSGGGVGSSSGSELDSKEAMASSLSNGGGSNSSGNASRSFPRVNTLPVEFLNSEKFMPP